MNVRIEGADRKLLGVAGVGIDVNFLRNKLISYQHQYGARLLLVNQAGQIVLASDASQGNLSELEDIGRHSQTILSHPSKALQMPYAGRVLCEVQTDSAFQLDSGCCSNCQR